MARLKSESLEDAEVEVGEPQRWQGRLGEPPGVVLGVHLAGVPGEGLAEHPVEVLGKVPGEGLGVHLGGVLGLLLSGVLDVRVAAVGHGLVPGSSQCRYRWY